MERVTTSAMGFRVRVGCASNLRACDLAREKMDEYLGLLVGDLSFDFGLLFNSK